MVPSSRAPFLATALLLNLTAGTAAQEAPPPQTTCAAPDPGPGCAATSCEALHLELLPPTPWIPDHRPGAFVATWIGGPPGGNPLRLATWWYDQDVENPAGPPAYGQSETPLVFEEVLERMEELYDLGIRRILLRLPAGSIRTQEADNRMASAQYWTMTHWRRAGFDCHVAAWIAEKAANNDPVSVGVYAGFDIDDTCSLIMDGATTPDPGNSEDLCTISNNIQPWIDLGFKEYWLDAASGSPQVVADIRRLTGIQDHIRIGGEAIPTVANPSQCGRLPNSGAFLLAPWMGWYRFVESRFPSPFGAPPWPLTQTPQIGLAAPAGSELGVVLEGGTMKLCGQESISYNLDDVYRYHRNGWTLWAAGSHVSTLGSYQRRPHVEALQRVLGFGTLAAGADFDSDGDVDQDDFQRFQSFLAAYRGQAGPVSHYHGDFDGDGAVSCRDELFFVCLYNAARQPTPDYRPLDLDDPSDSACFPTLSCEEPG